MRQDKTILEYYSEQLDRMPFGDASEGLLEQFDDSEQTQVLRELVIPKAMCAFAEKLYALTNEDEDPEDRRQIQNYFEVFCRVEHISEGLQNMIAENINSATQDEYDNDDDAGVITQTDWKDLSDDERIRKVKNFLRAIYNSGSDAKNIRPFIKQNIGDKPDPYNNVWGKNVKVRSNRYGPAEASVDEDATEWRGNALNRKGQSIGKSGPHSSREEAKQKTHSKYPKAHSISTGYGYNGSFDMRNHPKNYDGSLREEAIDESSRKDFQAVANTVRAIEDPKKRQEFANHHASIFAKQNPLFDHARFHAAAGTKFSGKSTIKETRSLPNLPIVENILDNSNIKKYTDFMDRTHVNTLNCGESPAEALREANKLRDEAAKREAQSGDAPYLPDDFIVGRTRPGRRK